MTTRLDPMVGQWYAHRDKGRPFQVVAVDDDGSVETQDLDGDVDEIDRDSWFSMSLVATDEPETEPLDAAADEADGQLAADGGGWREPGAILAEAENTTEAVDELDDLMD